MSLRCAAGALFAALLGAVALRVASRGKDAYPGAGTRLRTGVLRILLLLRAGRMRGALITRIEADSAAEKTGLKTGDVIVQFAGQRVRNVQQLRERVAAAQAGTNVRIDLLRDGCWKSLIVTITKSPEANVPLEQQSDKA